MSLEMLTVLLDILIIAIIFIGGLFTKHYLPTYMDKKGENLATKEDVEEITTPGINIGHWNYPKYRFSVRDSNIMVNNDKLIFYHFSGFRIVNKNDIRQIHEEDRINQPFIYEIYRKLLTNLIDEVEKIDPTFIEYKTVAEVEDN